jgi:hypothetical protein
MHLRKDSHSKKVGSSKMCDYQIGRLQVTWWAINDTILIL